MDIPIGLDDAGMCETYLNPSCTAIIILGGKKVSAEIMLLSHLAPEHTQAHFD